MAAAADADWVTRLVLAWLAAKRSPNTRAAYACDIGITPPQRTSRAASWLAWCQAEGVHPVTGITGLHVTQYAFLPSRATRDAAHVRGAVLEAGGSPRDLQAALGHSDARTTRRYDRAGHTSGRPPGHMIAAYLEDPS